MSWLSRTGNGVASPVPVCPVPAVGQVGAGKAIATVSGQEAGWGQQGKGATAGGPGRRPRRIQIEPNLELAGNAQPSAVPSTQTGVQLGPGWE